MRNWWPSQHLSEWHAFKMPDGSTIRYGLALPPDYSASSPRPLVIALHPGGGGTPYYGDQYMRTIFAPGLRELGAIADRARLPDARVDRSAG